MNETREKILQWLQMLFIVQLIRILLSCMGQLSLVVPLPLLGSWMDPVETALELAVVICLFLLPWYYRLSAICKAVTFLFSIYPKWLPYLMPVIPVKLYMQLTEAMGWVILVLSVAAIFLEYRCHGRTAPGLKGKWMLLFGISAGISLTGQLVIVLCKDAITRMLISGHTWGIKAYNLTTLLLGAGVSVCYLLLLHKTINHFQEEEV